MPYKTVCIDFDGTITNYKEFKRKGIFDEVLPGCRGALKRLKDDGWTIIIFTTRLETYLVRQYLEDNGIPFDYINSNPTNEKLDCHPFKPLADVYIDDRAITFEGYWHDMDERVKAFKPWYKGAGV